ncbi:putative membrane protein [Escherichia coli MP020940.1]|nr:putative membrane protein [Escherichia coli]EMX57402.1 putative membrane protein [Escherichia coli MP020940.1]EMZ92797.1 putative membrane protein [Escherichia coli P0304816.1]ENF18420.1 putative membrane protein [Escherichia coli P0304816.11]ENF20030.1 putative membrane protein [Escherichia coli P0304816.10]ENF29493.1 putative membrane protein [Escherichia coli P0304816.12]ENF29836.1 putative membrane protein [Escherichia coli P0304816.14]ENF39252.1 putative membrane protein [Escherichia
MLWESSYPEIFLIPALSFSYLHGCQYIIIFTSNMDNFNLGLLL